jgi:hypothetical protein
MRTFLSTLSTKTLLDLRRALLVDLVFYGHLLDANYQYDGTMDYVYCETLEVKTIVDKILSTRTDHFIPVYVSSFVDSQLIGGL